MSDSYSSHPGEGAVLAADEIGGVKYPRVKIVFGACGEYTDVTLDNPLPVSMTGGGSSSGGLTNTELRAAAVPVSGSFYQATQPVSGTFWQTTQPVSIAATVAVSGPLTDAQLRASALPVSGTFYPATQPVSGTVAVSGNVAVTGTFWQATQPVSGTFWQATQPVSGPLTDTQLRASAVPVSGTFFQSTQPVSVAATLATRDLKDNARSIVNAATAIAGVTAVSSEALLSLNVSRDGAATAGVTTIAVTSGKKLRIIGITAGVISTAAAVISARVALRLNPSGAVSVSSPVLTILAMSQQAAALAQAGDSQTMMFPEAIEISGTMQVGLSQICSATTGTVWASLIAYEY
jgi:hypothetical protein